MKKLTLFYILMNVSLLAFPQAIHIFHDGEITPDVIANEGIDSIYLAPKFLGSTEFQQVFVTKDGEKRYNVVDSVKFNLPHLVASHHTIFIPSDYGELRVACSCLGGNEPILIFQDGNTKSPYHFDERGPHIWNLRANTKNGEHVPEAARSEMWYIVSDEMQDSIIVNYTGLPFANNAYTEVGFSAEDNEYTLDTNLPDSRLNISDRFDEEEFLEVEGVDWYYNEEGKPVIHFSRNESGERKRGILRLFVGPFEILERTWMVQLGKPFMHTSEEHMAALHDFCDSTDFETWGKNTNWWSDEPLWKWDYRINQEANSNFFWHIDDHIVSMFFGGGQYTGVHGTIPASFEIILDDIQGELNLGGCALYGVIPYNVRHSQNWPKYGWSIINQDMWFGGGFDMEDINLRMEDEEIMYADGTKGTAYEELAKHKLILISVGAPSEGMRNLCLDYKDKGFEYIYAAQDWYGGTLEDAMKSVKEFEDIPNVTVCYQSWANDGNLSDGLHQLGSTFLLDSVGNVIDFAGMDFSIGDDFYTNRLGKNLLKYLGEPEEHDPYIPKPAYTSTDYSHDGEVLTLQKATVGKGIDLVFMGDMYVDTLLVNGGLYEQDMRSAMEYFFEIEPYKTLRDRFNVYAVKVVSPNGLEGTEHKFNFNNDLVFEYAQKVPDVDMDHVAVTVINNDKNIFFESGETTMWESGASIAWIEKGGPSTIICHETGGHGIAKLLDEYIYGGYEENHTQEGANEEFREWIKTTYHDKGWGMNISATDDPEEVPWAHFLKDERYQDEVGIYQGAWFWPEELWRSSENSVMREGSYLWFNAPSREAIYKNVMQLSEGDDWTYDYEKFVEFDTPFREAHKQALAKVRKLEGEGHEIQKPRIELRPPTIYKGSWRDAGNCEKMTFDNEKYVQPNTSKRKVEKSMGMGTRMGRETQQKQQRPYFMYQGTRYDVDEFDKKMLNVK